jgi:hypothetical protein
MQIEHHLNERSQFVYFLLQELVNANGHCRIRHRVLTHVLEEFILKQYISKPLTSCGVLNSQVFWVTL